MINHDSQNSHYEEKPKPNRIFLNKQELLISPSHRSEITDEKQESSSMPSSVLLVTITNIKFPVNADVLFSVFNKYGDVQKIIIFEKQQGEQALVEMLTVDQAIKAKEQTTGQYIYSDTNLMHVEFSRRKKLSVKIQT